MQSFSYQALASRVVFGPGVRHRVADEATRLGVTKAMVVCSAGQRADGQDMVKALGPRAAGLFAEAAMHTPIDVTRRALAWVQAAGADGVLAIGGGSAIGLSKAIALHTDMPQIVLPTSYAGSEMTPILGQTVDGVKTTERTLKVLPEVVLYDVELTLTLPPAFSATSGLNAMAHAAEALYARDANPVISLLAEEGVRTLAQALPQVVREPADREARGAAQYGAYLSGACLGAVGMSLHHKLCHALGGTFNLPHAETHAVLLAHALRYNASHAPHAMAQLRRALGAVVDIDVDGDGGDVPLAVWRLARGIGAPVSLAELGMPREGLERVVDMALAAPYWNPRPLVRDALLQMLQDAWVGNPPGGP